MILYDTDYAEIYRQMSAEREKAKYYSQKYSREAIRKFERHRLPCEHHVIQTMPASRNTYMHYYYAAKEAEVRDNCIFFGNLLLVNDMYGKQYAIRLMSVSILAGAVSVGTADSLNIFTGHFLSRYRERFSYLKDVPSHELIASFAGRNLGYIHPLDYKEFVLEENRQENGAAWGIDDGVSLGQSWLEEIDGTPVIINLHKTFLGRHILNDRQRETAPSQEEMRSSLMNHFILKNHYKNG